MTILYIWICVTFLAFAYFYSLIYIVGTITRLLAADTNDNHGIENKTGALHRRIASTRAVRALTPFASATGLLAAWSHSNWIMDFNLALIALVSTAICALIHFYGPQAAKSYYTKEEYDSHLKGAVAKEIQKLLGRVGAFQNKTKSDDSYREIDALIELEEYLKTRIQK